MMWFSGTLLKNSHNATGAQQRPESETMTSVKQGQGSPTDSPNHIEEPLALTYLNGMKESDFL